MPKPGELSGDVKQAAKAEDRHNPTQPTVDPKVWARGLTTSRVADLFKTLPGLPGHWAQIQSAVNAGNNHFHTQTNHGQGMNDGGKTSSEGKELIKWIADAIVKAAGAAKFDFPEQKLQFTKDMGWLKIARTAGKVVVKSRP